ncbi:MAG: CoA activase [Syntrophobacteraceae bacterium CG07_land_8_20_14_0_80_61_8]|nr:MAG: CoA activase [Syntrophobacteraceae bacterium CG07_land_8_20_14_0_80_61_8]
MALDVGIDIGSVSINGIVIDEPGEIVWEAPYLRHFGLVREQLEAFLERLQQRFEPASIRSVSFTGIHGERLAAELNAPYEVETIAQVLGAVRVVPGVRTIISIGGQDAALFQLSHDGRQWHLDAFNMNGPCASGTGSFIDQQAERLASSIYGERVELDQEHTQTVLDDFIALGSRHTDPAPVACRCTVFTKSDMIHLQNKGEPLANIVAGLHFGNAANYLSTIVGNRKLHSPVIFIGGLAGNRLQVEAFKKYFPDLVVPPHYASLGALGVALQSQQLGRHNSVGSAALQRSGATATAAFPRAAPLSLKLTRFHADNRLAPRDWDPARPIESFLGIDVGSTTTKYALIDGAGNLLHKCYLQTRGKPIEVTQELLRTLEREVAGRVHLVGIATTGSGRNVVGDFVEADLIIDEITAHAGGAVAVDPAVDTIFEIGGQDSKYIRIDQGHPLDFDMNKVCAAGTGSFLHELANKLRINIVGEFEAIALASRQPVALAERCTVFMESDLMSHAQKGADRGDLIAGLCYAIVHNYLNRVVGKRSIGKRVMFLGGPSLNRGIVAAFEQVLGKPLLVPRHREVLGGYGAALALKAGFERGDFSGRDRDLAALGRVSVEFVESVCRADPKCHNECKLKVYDFCGRKSIWGGECARYEITRGGTKPALNLFAERLRLFQAALGPAAMPVDNSGTAVRSGSGRAPTVGIPLAIHAWEWGVLWVTLFQELGFEVRLTAPTSPRVVASGVESMTAETCFPIKVFHGHVKQLLDQAEYLFLPNLIDMPGPDPAERGLFCPLVESSQYMARAAFGIEARRLICPDLYLKKGAEGLGWSLLEALPKEVRGSRAVIERAVTVAWEAQSRFRRRLIAAGRRFLARRTPGVPLWVVTGRPYNLHDERLNLKLGRHLARLGIEALPMDFLEVDGVDLSDFPRMYWGLGARILRTAKLIGKHPDWYGMHLTNFSCGADSFIEHFYRRLLQDKPPLILELDEHSAVAGALTRLEAYRNVVNNIQARRLDAGGRESCRGAA